MQDSTNLPQGPDRVNSTKESARRTWKDHLQLIALMGFVGVLPWSRIVSTLTLDILLVVSALNFQWTRFVLYRRVILACCALYGVGIISFFYSPHVSNALFELQKQLPLLLLPLLLPPSLSLDPPSRKWVITCFTATVLLACVYLGLRYGLKIITEHLPFHQWFDKTHINQAFSRPIGMEPNYFSLYVSLCLFILLRQAFKPGAFYEKLGWIILSLILFLEIILLNSRMVTLLDIGLAGVFIPVTMFRLKGIALAVSAVVIIAAGSFFLFSSPFLGQRWLGDALQDLTIESHGMYNYAFPNDISRGARWRCAALVIAGRPLTGYGTGEERPRLMAEYQQKGMTLAMQYHYDSHNEYLAYGIRSGLPGIIILIFVFAYGLNEAIRKKNIVHICFMVLVMGICLSENLLESSAGIFFYAFFNIFFLL